MTNSVRDLINHSNLTGCIISTRENLLCEKLLFGLSLGSREAQLPLNTLKSKGSHNFGHLPLVRSAWLVIKETE